MTTERLKRYCQQLVAFLPDELALVDAYFVAKQVRKGSFLLEEGHICDFITFIEQGIIRHFHTKEGVEKTCDLSFQDTFITEFTSFTKNVPSLYAFQALQDCEVFFVKKADILRLYEQCPKYETIGRLAAESVAQRATEIAMSLSSEKPEERYKKLILKHPDLFQQVQQKYIANFLGISPESLSRIRKRVAIQERS